MQNISQALAALAALLGPVATIIGLVQSRAWLTVIGALLFVIAAGAALWAIKQRRRMAAASVEIEGISIDSLNAANLRRRVNRSLFVQSAEHLATIDGSALDIVWRYSGYCRAEHESAMEFSVDSGTTLPFQQLDCFAFDLERDPQKQYPIQPVLLGPDGISKKISVPFLEPLRASQPFNLMLHCHMPMIYRRGVCHYTSTLSFDQDRVGRCTVHLKFLREKPAGVRVYVSDASGYPRLLKNLHPLRADEESTEYRDVAENIDAQSVRIYLFKRD